MSVFLDLNANEKTDYVSEEMKNEEEKEMKENKPEITEANLMVCKRKCEELNTENVVDTFSNKHDLSGINKVNVTSNFNSVGKKLKKSVSWADGFAKSPMKDNEEGILSFSHLNFVAGKEGETRKTDIFIEEINNEVNMLKEEKEALLEPRKVSTPNDNASSHNSNSQGEAKKLYLPLNSLSYNYDYLKHDETRISLCVNESLNEKDAFFSANGKLVDVKPEEAALQGISNASENNEIESLKGVSETNFKTPNEMDIMRQEKMENCAIRDAQKSKKKPGGIMENTCKGKNEGKTNTGDNQIKGEGTENYESELSSNSDNSNEEETNRKNVSEEKEIASAYEGAHIKIKELETNDKEGGNVEQEEVFRNDINKVEKENEQRRRRSQEEEEREEKEKKDHESKTEFEVKESTKFFGDFTCENDDRSKFNNVVEGMIESMEYIDDTLHREEKNDKNELNEKENVYNETTEEQMYNYVHGGFLNKDHSSAMNGFGFSSVNEYGKGNFLFYYLLAEKQKLYLQKPARKQVDVAKRKKVAYTEGNEEYNIWYGKYLSDRYEKNWKERVASLHKCKPDQDTGYTKANKSNNKDFNYICIFFARGCCCLGSECTYRHMLPTEQDEFQLEMSKDIFGRERYAHHSDDMSGVGSFNHECRTLFVGGLVINKAATNILEKTKSVLLAEFQAFGAIEDLKVILKKNIAFVTYKYRVAAEFAKEAMGDQPIDMFAYVLSVKWAHEQHNAISGNMSSNTRNLSNDLLLARCTNNNNELLHSYHNNFDHSSYICDYSTYSDHTNDASRSNNNSVIFCNNVNNSYNESKFLESSCATGNAEKDLHCAVAGAAQQQIPQMVAENGAAIHSGNCALDSYNTNNNNNSQHCYNSDYHLDVHHSTLKNNSGGVFSPPLDERNNEDDDNDEYYNYFNQYFSYDSINNHSYRSFVQYSKNNDAHLNEKEVAMYLHSNCPSERLRNSSNETQQVNRFAPNKLSLLASSPAIGPETKEDSDKFLAEKFVENNIQKMQSLLAKIEQRNNKSCMELSV